MTSVVQPRLEVASAKAASNSETPRARANKPDEEVAEGGFAAVLAAQTFPAATQPAKAVESEAERVPTEALDIADAGEAELAEGAMKAVALSSAMEAPLQALASEMVMAESPELAASPQPVSPAGVGEGVVVDPELIGSERKAQRDQSAVERPSAKSIELGNAEAISPEPRPATPAAHVAQAPATEAGTPQKQGPPPAMLGEGADESKRLVETAATNTTLRRVDDLAAIAFRVRRENPVQDTRHSSERPDWMRANANNAAEAQPQHATAVQIAARTVDKAIASEATKAVRPAAVTPTIDMEVHKDHGQDEAQEDRSHSKPALDRLLEAPTKSMKSSVARLAPELEVPTDASKQVAAKPATPALPANAPPMTVQANAQAEPAAVQPRDDMPAASSASPSRTLEVAAQLQQQHGRTTLNVVLHDERLGRVALQLVERGGWIETAIRASEPRTAHALSNGAAGLFDALQQRGLTFTTSGGSASAWDAQEGQRRDNPQRDRESQGRRFRLRRSTGEFAGALARAEV